MANLPVNQGVVNFLTKRGFKPQVGDKFPFFNERRRMYESLGLNSQLGDYQGSEQQNQNLEKGLLKAETMAGTPLTQLNYGELIKIASGKAQPLGQKTTIQNYAEGKMGGLDPLSGINYPTLGGQPYGPNLVPGVEPNIAQKAKAAITKPQSGAGGTAPVPVTKPDGGALTAEQQAAARTPEEIAAQQAKKPTENRQEIINGNLYEIYPDGGKKLMAINVGEGQYLTQQMYDAQQAEGKRAHEAQLYLDKLMSDPKLQAEKAKADLEKEGFKTKAEQDKKKLLADLGSRGIYGGAQKQGKAAIDADQISRELSVDQRFAGVIASAIQQDQQEQQKADEAFLRSQGLARDPATGQVYPTFEAQRAALADERAYRSELRAEDSAERAARAEERSIDASNRAAVAFQMQLENFRTKDLLPATGQNIAAGIVGIHKDDVGDLFFGYTPTDKTPSYADQQASPEAKAKAVKLGVPPWFIQQQIDDAAEQGYSPYLPDDEVYRRWNTAQLRAQSVLWGNANANDAVQEFIERQLSEAAQ